MAPSSGWAPSANHRSYRANLEGLARLRAELDAFWGPALRDLKRAAEDEGAS